MGALRITRRLAGIPERSDASGEERRAELELAAFLKTPQGQARLAFGQGASMFQIDLPHSETRHGTVLGAVESEGWRLEHVDYMFEQRSFVRRDRRGDASGIVGVYIFRRAEPPRREEPAKGERGRPADVPASAPLHISASAPVLEPLPPISTPNLEPLQSAGSFPLRPPDSA
jgi:hypothetical protein